MKFKFNFAGLIAGLVSIPISARAIQQQDYLWLIGSIPLLVLGMILQINRKETAQ